jgi:transcription elongation factor Elf1
MNDLDVLFTQQKYAEQLSSRLDKFTLKRSSPFQANFRCDICGDSQKNKNKKRGGIIEKDMNLFYNCFNCGESHIFPNYLRLYHPDMYQRYVFDVKTNNKSLYNYEEREPEPEPELSLEKNPLKNVKKARDNTFAYRYLKARKIPEDKIDLFYYVDKFYEYINSIMPGKFNEYALNYDHERIIIPFFDIMGTCFAVQGRSMDDTSDQRRYITILFDKDQTPIYGLNTVDWNKTVYCTEGPIDSLFLENAIAASGSDNMSIDKKVVIVLDNEPRNEQLLKKYDKYIHMNYQICIWPENLEFKDINEMIDNGIISSEIQSIIDKNTYYGIKARIKFNKWKKM